VWGRAGVGPGRVAIQSALDFFRTVRQRPDLQERIRSWGPAPSIHHLTELAGELGFACTATELQQAFRYDWTMRWLHVGGQADAGGPAPTIAFAARPDAPWTRPSGHDGSRGSSSVG
jgi:hypothetical protein